jgi:hypothetical protein
MKPVICICIIWYLLYGCQQEEELISGDISGIISTYYQDLTLRADQSGIPVNLYDKDNVLIGEQFTDTLGRYTFENIAYGRYRLDPQLENFVKEGISHTVYHAGGYSPTVFNSGLYEIPTFELMVDSIRWYAFSSVMAYMKIKDGIPLPVSLYPLRCFFSITPLVSKDDFIIQGYGTIWFLSPAQETAYGEIHYIDKPFDTIGSDTVYCCFYPMAFGQGSEYNNDYAKEALGKPSNVVQFVWNE